MDSDALKRLIEAVERGEQDLSAFPEILKPDAGLAYLNVYKANGNGDLNAAKALHDALLPGWTACVGQNAHHGDWNAFVRLVEDGRITKEHYGGTDDSPARAWLLAILRAQLAEADNHAGRDKTAV